MNPWTSYGGLGQLWLFLELFSSPQAKNGKLQKLSQKSSEQKHENSGEHEIFFNYFFSS